MRYLLDIPEYHADGFKTEAGRTRLYFKSDPPPPPDYIGAANATAAGNLEAAKYATQANRINQVTPYGSLTYNYTPQYDAEGKETGAGWTQTMNLSPQAQATLDKQMALSDKYAQTATEGFDKVQGLLSNPELDVSGLPARAIDVGQTAQQAIMSRLQPQLAQQEEALAARLANQGITLGSDAYGHEMNLQGQRANDLQLQAALQGINLDQANRSAALQEQAYLQDRPLNLINALRTGAQVQSPQFQQFAQQATTAGPDVLGATNAQYQAEVDATNAQNAQAGGLMSGLMGVGLGIAGLPVAGGGSLFGNYLNTKLSDRRLKKNIKQVGKMDNGLNIYSYEYVWGGPTELGVMAQEVEKVNPDAVFEVNGYKAVKYDRL